MLRFPPIQWAALTCFLIGCLVWINLPSNSATIARGAVISLNPSEDAFVNSAVGNRNYGGAGAFAVSATKGSFESWLKFDLSTAKTNFDAAYGQNNWLIESVTLQLTTANVNNALFNANIFPSRINTEWIANDAWTEGNGTPAIDSNSGLVFDNVASLRSANDILISTITVSSASTATYNLPLVAGLSDDIVLGSNATLRLSAADTNSSVLFNSRSFNTTSSRPVLTITAVAVPEPNSMAIVSVILFGYAYRTVRKRKWHSCPVN